LSQTGDLGETYPTDPFIEIALGTGNLEKFLSLGKPNPFP
jgi:hypothetical protein